MKSIVRPIEFVSPLSEVEVRLTLRGLCGSKWDSCPFKGEVNNNSFRFKKKKIPFLYTQGVPEPILIGEFAEQDKQTRVTISLAPRIADIFIT